MAILMPEGKQSFADDAGNPLAGGKLYTYAAGTTTPKTTWADSAQTAPNTNPIILDARGEASVFWNGAYKVELRTSTDVVIWTVDNVTTGATAGSITTAALADGAVTTPKIADQAVTAAKLLNSTAARSAFAAVLGYIDGGNPISITGTTTLDSTAFGRLFIIYGTAANYTVTLPTPVGQANNAIAIRVSVAATKLFTLAGSAGASIGTEGQLQYTMWAGESVTLVSDGTDWQIADRYRRPLSGFVQRTSGLALTAGVYAPIVMNAAGGDIAGLNLCFDSVNGRFQSPRLTNWIITATASFTATAAARTTCDLGVAYNNTTTPQANLLDTTTYEIGDTRRFLKVVCNIALNAGDYLVPIGRLNGGTTPSVEYAAGAIVPTLYFTEAPL